MAETIKLTNELLKGKMTDAMVYRGTGKCLEDCILPGYYLLDGDSTTTEPEPYPSWKYSILEVMKRGADILQRITNIDGYPVIVRSKRMGVWQSWYRIEMTKVT